MGTAAEMKGKGIAGRFLMPQIWHSPWAAGALSSHRAGTHRPAHTGSSLRWDQFEPGLTVFFGEQVVSRQSQIGQ